MKKKFIVTDADGEQFVITEEEATEETPTEEVPTNDEGEDETLTAEEVKALKGLAAVAGKLVALVSEQAEDACHDEDEPTEEVTEEVVTTDSVKGAGSIEEKKNKALQDSIAKQSRQDAINERWNKRLNGGK